MVHSAHSIAASDDSYQSVLIEHLEMGPATYLNIDPHGKTTADIHKRLTELYRGNGLQRFWIVDGKPGPRPTETLAVLEDAESQRRFLNTANCKKSWPNIAPLPQKTAGRQCPQEKR